MHLQVGWYGNSKVLTGCVIYDGHSCLLLRGAQSDAGCHSYSAVWQRK